MKMCYNLIPGSAKHVPGWKFRKRDVAYRNSWWVGKKWIEMKWGNQVTWMTWHEGIETHELKRMNCHEWNEWNEWNKGIEVNWLKQMNWHEWFETESKGMNWNSTIDSNELNWKNDWLDMNDLNELPKVLRTLSFFFYVFYVKPSSRYSLVHIVSTSSSKTGLRLAFLYDFLCEIKLLLQSRAHFVDRDPPAATTDGHFSRKCTGFCARERFQPWIPAFPIAHTSQLLDDDVIDMMMLLSWWLSWWCSCHDGETASHWQSSVTRKFPN